MDFTLALTLTAEEMKFVIWLALTPALSPGERVSKAASLENSFITIAVADAASSFAEKTVRQPRAFALPETGEPFSLSWGRGPG